MGRGMSRFAILLGGEVTPTPRLAAQLAGARVIAADSGIRHAAPLALKPELWVGDFDSVTPELLAANDDVPRERFERDKDFTDGELAILAARKAGATALVMAGAFGGPRADHAFLHLAQAVSLAEQGLPVLLTDGLQEGRPLLPGTHVFEEAEGTLFSIIAFGALSGLTVTGAKWPLDDVEVGFGSSLTISNEVSGKLTITLGAGRALLVTHLAGDRQG